MLHRQVPEVVGRTGKVLATLGAMVHGYMNYIWPIFVVKRLIAKFRESKDLPPED